MTVGQPGGITFPTGQGIGATQDECAVMSLTRAAGLFPIMTVIEPMAIRPYAFGWTDPTAPDLIPNQEVASAFWTPFDDLRDPERATTYEASRAGEPRTFQAIDIGGDPPLWGLTHRMVQDLLARLPV